VVEPELRGALQTQDIVYDVRSRRLTATLMLPGSAAMRLRPVRVVGQMVETVEVVVPLRTINRGEIIQAGDIMLERRPRDATANDTVVETTAAIGKAARRVLSSGQLLRANDLQRQEIVARNEIVTVVYQAPGLMLTMRGRAQEAGAQGDIVSVMNVQSKKILQATVIGQGRVAVNGAGAPAGRIAAAN
jgi:flagellar basal body P-ring formation protein FlgA